MDSILDAPTGLADQALFRHRESGPTYGMELSDGAVIQSIAVYTTVVSDKPHRINLQRNSGWMRPVVQELAELAVNPDYVGVPPRITTINGAAMTLSQLMLPETVRPNILASPEGGITAEWLVNGIEFGLDFEPDGRVIAWFDDHEAGEEWEGDLADRLGQVLLAISKLRLQS